MRKIFLINIVSSCLALFIGASAQGFPTYTTLDPGGANHTYAYGIDNGAGIGNESIGTIRIFDRSCRVDLREHFPQDLLETFRIVMIAGQSPRMPQMAGSLPVRGHVKDGQRLQNTPLKNTKSKPKRYH